MEPFVIKINDRYFYEYKNKRLKTSRTLAGAKIFVKPIPEKINKIFSDRKIDFEIQFIEETQKCAIPEIKIIYNCTGHLCTLAKDFLHVKFILEILESAKQEIESAAVVHSLNSGKSLDYLIYSDLDINDLPF